MMNDHANRALLQKKLGPKTGKVVGGVFLVYVLIYSVLSAFGSYQPRAVDARGVTGYWWAPVGFYDAKHAGVGSSDAIQHSGEQADGWRPFMFWTFAPLFHLDNQFIHKGPPSGSSLKPTAALE